MDDVAAPQWLISAGVLEIRSADETTKELVLVNNNGRADVAFGEIPPGWSIRIVAGPSHARTQITSSGQGRNVKWRLEPDSASSWVLPRSATGVEISPRSAGHRVTVEYPRNGAHLRLGPGDYDMRTGDGGTGTYTAELIGSPAQRDAVSLSGTSKVSRVSGKAGVRLVVASPAPSLEVVGDQDRVNIQGNCATLKIRTLGAVTLSGSVTDLLDIHARTVTSGHLTAAGRLEATQVTLDQGASPNGRLEVCYSEFFVAAESVHRLDLRPVAEEGSVPRAIVGARDATGRLALEPEPQHVRDLAAPTPTPSVITTQRLASDAKLTEATIDGTGDVEVSGLMTASTINLGGRLIVRGRLSLDAAPSSDVTLLATEVVVGAELVLNGCDAEVATYVQAESVASGTISPVGGSSLTVTARHFDDVRITATAIGVHPSDRSALAVLRSQLEASHNLQLNGLVDGESHLRLQGNGHINGEIQVGTELNWMPGDAWRAGDPKVLVVSAIAPVIHVDGRPERSNPAVLRYEMPLGPKSLTVAGAVVIETPTSQGTTSIDTLEAMDGSELQFTGPDAKVQCLQYSGTCQLSLERLQSDAVLSLVLAPASDSSVLVAAASLGSISIERDPDSSRPDGRERRHARVRARNGIFSVDDWLAEFDCGGTNEKPVTLGVGENGRIDNIRGEFRLSQMRGRVEGNPQRGETDLPVLTAWPKQPGSVESSGRVGELTNVDISKLPARDVAQLTGLHVLSPLPAPLMRYARSLGPQYWRQVWTREADYVLDFQRNSADNIRSEAQRLREIADIVRSRANSSATFTAAQWAASHAHALQVTFGAERALRFLHRLVGYGVRPFPALASYMVWVAGVSAALLEWDSEGPEPGVADDFRAGPYEWFDSVKRALLLPAAVLRSDFGGAKPYSPAFHDPAAHYGLVIGTGIVIGFLVLAIKNYLVRPKSMD